jgi:signal transduction histidine kinase
VAEPPRDLTPEPWGEDAKLDALIGVPGAAALRAMFDRLPDALCLLWAIRDADGSLTDFDIGYSNPPILRLFGLRRPPPPGSRLLGMLPQMVGTGEFAAYARVCDTGEPFTDELTFDVPIGEGRIQGRLTRRVAKFGDGIIVFVTDVTAQRRAEAELRGYADMVAHDLREPVIGMAHLVSLLERRADAPPDPQVLELMRASTVRARDLIDGVLAYARAGELRRERVDLGSVMEEVADDLGTRLDEAGATVEVGSLPAVDGDRRQLRRLLQNLVGNAVKFRGDAPPRVSVSAAQGPEAWVVSVLDNGPGIDPAEASRIFGMFARARAGADGTGIGLAICRRVVEAHGGRIWVEPRKGGGSAFRFTLPRSL